MTNAEAPRVSPPSTQSSGPLKPPVWPHRVSLEIPYVPLLAERIRTLQTQVGLAGDAPVGFPFGMTFSIPDDATQRFFSAVLGKIQPLTVLLPCVEAQVEGRQTYRAGWRIDDESQDQLRRMRAGLIASLKSAPIDLVPLGSLLLVADNVPAGAFPALIAAMQRNFEPIAWSINAVRLVDDPPGTKPDND